MATPVDSAVLLALGKLRAAWPNPTWSWDGRLPTVTSCVDHDQFDTAEKLVMLALPRRVTSATLGDAPAEFRAIVDRAGGLRGAQLAFFDDATLQAFGLWWPWGGGKTISLRVGLVGAHQDAELSNRLRALFGIED